MLHDRIDICSGTAEFSLDFFTAFRSGRGTPKGREAFALGLHSLAKDLGCCRIIFLGLGLLLNCMLGEGLALQGFLQKWIASRENLGSCLLSKLLQPNRSLVCQVEAQEA